MTRVLVVLWAYLLCWLSSALLHVVDADVGSIRGLGNPSVLVSVSIVALIIFVPVLLCHRAYRRGCWPQYFKTVAMFAVGLGLVVVMLGFGGRSVSAWLLGFFGLAALFGLMIVAATLPTVWIERRQHRRVRAEA